MEKQDKGCLKVRDYNAMMTTKWREDCNKASLEGRWSSMPQLAMYLFFTPNGNLRKTGYVAWSKNSAVCQPTKRQAIALVKQYYGVTIW